MPLSSNVSAKVVARDGRVSWGDSPLIVNPFDEYAIEAGLQQKETLGAEITALCIGGETTKNVLKHALAKGADNAILVNDTALAELDSQGAAHILAAAIKKNGGVDMVIFGRQTLDNGTGLTTAQTARALDWPMLALAGSIKIEESKRTVSANQPVILSVVQSIGEPRYPSFIGIRKASKTEIPVWTLADLGITDPIAVVSRIELMNPPSRDIPCEIIGGNSPEEIADKMVEKILAEKVL